MQELLVFGVAFEALFTGLEKGLCPGLDFRLFQVEPTTGFHLLHFSLEKGKDEFRFSFGSPTLKVLFHDVPPSGQLA